MEDGPVAGASAGEGPRSGGSPAVLVDLRPVDGPRSARFSALHKRIRWPNSFPPPAALSGGADMLNTIMSIGQERISARCRSQGS